MVMRPQETIGLMLRGHLVINNNNKYKNSATYVHHEQFVS